MFDTVGTRWGGARCGLASISLWLAVAGCGRVHYDAVPHGDAGMDAVSTDSTVTDAPSSNALIVVTPTTGLTTSEAGATDMFSVRLGRQPAAAVTVALQSSNLNEGTLSRLSLTFTLLNWNAPQTVTVIGHDDEAADGPQTYSVITSPAASGDPDFDGFDADDVEVTNLDNELAAVVVTPTSGLHTSESGAATGFAITLNRAPAADVTIGLSSDSPDEVSVSPTSVTLTNADYASPHIVTLTGLDDSSLDGPHLTVVVTSTTTSSDPDFNALEVPDVLCVNDDDESAALAISGMASLTTTESGGTATFGVALQSMPSADVTVPIASDDLGEGVVSPASITFSPTDWNMPRLVTVTGVDDALADGDQPFNIALGPCVSADTEYDARVSASVPIVNADNDTPGIDASPASGLITTEGGGTAMFSVTLSTQPSSSVVLSVASSDTSEGTASTAFLMFTPANWSTPHDVTVTGANDSVADGPQPYQITLHATAGSDPAYIGVDDAIIDLTNNDDETAGVTVSPTSGLVTTEAGVAATFTIVLTSMPTTDVTVPLSSTDITEGTVSPASATFTPGNWNVPQTITATGVDDLEDDGNLLYSIVTGATTSADSHYSGINPADVSLTNLDDEFASFAITPTSGLVTTESGGTATFTVVLTSQPTGNVTLPLTSSRPDEGTASAASLVFTALDWDTPQTVTVTGQADVYIDGDQPYLIATGAAVSTDTSYSGLNPSDVSVTNHEPPCTTDRFDAASTFATAANPTGIATGDLDNDGDLDLVTSGGSNLSVLLGDGVGGFGAATTYPPGAGSLGSPVLGDFNRDGLLDVANSTSTGVRVHLNTGLGVLAAAVTYAVGGGG